MSSTYRTLVLGVMLRVLQLVRCRVRTGIQLGLTPNPVLSPQTKEGLKTPCQPSPKGQ